MLGPVPGVTPRTILTQYHAHLCLQTMNVRVQLCRGVPTHCLLRREKFVPVILLRRSNALRRHTTSYQQASPRDDSLFCPSRSKRWLMYYESVRNYAGPTRQPAWLAHTPRSY